MIKEALPSILIIQFVCAAFVFFDARRRRIPDPWLWIIGVALFMPFFLPFYILLRPRQAFIYCPNCQTSNTLPVINCKNCGTEISIENPKTIQKEWGLLDAITILILSLFILPMSLVGLGNILGFVDRDWTNWSGLFLFSFTGFVLLIIISIWFVSVVCSRPLADIGLKRTHLYRNIILGFIFVIPAFIVGAAAEEIIIRVIIVSDPSQAEDIQLLQDDEHSGEAVIWPESAGDEMAKFLGVSFLVIILGPFGEEILFRGIIYNALRQKRNKWMALFMTSILFAIVHGQVIHFIPIFLIGFIITYLVERTKSLVPAITMHILINLLFTILWYNTCFS